MKIKLRSLITEADGVLQFIVADGLSDKVYIKNLTAFLKEQSEFKQNRFHEDNFKNAKVMSDIRDRENLTDEEKEMEKYNTTIVTEYNDKDQLISRTDESDLNGDTKYFAESTSLNLLQEKSHDDNENLSKSRIRALRDKQKKYEDEKNIKRADNMRNSADTIQNNRNAYADELNNSRSTNAGKMDPEERDRKRSKFILRVIKKMNNSKGGKLYDQMLKKDNVVKSLYGAMGLGGLAGYMSADDGITDDTILPNDSVPSTALGAGLGYFAGVPIIAGGLVYGQKYRKDKFKEAQDRANRTFK